MSFIFGRWKVEQHAATPEQEQLPTGPHNRVAYRIESRYSSTPESTPAVESNYCDDILLSAISLKLKDTNTDPHLILGFLSGPRVSDRDSEQQNSANLVPELFDLVGWDFTTMDAAVDFLQPFIEQAAARNRQLSLAGRPSSDLDFSAGYARLRSSSDTQGGSHAKLKLHWNVGVALWKHREGCRQKEGTRAKLAVLAAVHFAEAASLCSPSPTSSPLLPSELAGNVLLATLTMVADSECPGALDYESFCQLPGLRLLPLPPLKECDFTKLQDLYPTSPCVFEAVFVVLLRFKLLGQARKALDVVAGLIQQSGGLELSVVLNGKKVDLTPPETRWLRLAKHLRDASLTSITDFSRFIDELGVTYFDDGSTMQGEFRHGQGELQLADGMRYKGEFKEGKTHGQGTMTLASGNVYTGEYKNGKRDGQGTYNFSNGDVYAGGYKEDDMHGQGTFTRTNGAIYEGEYKEDQKDGQGTYTCSNGDVYVGEYKEDKKDGRGTFTWANGTIYAGEYKEDKMHGQGTYTYANRDGYVGEWKEDKRHGRGTFTCPTGDGYVGEWKEDNMHGRGTFTWANGTIYAGEYKEDKMHGHGTMTFPSGNVYKGEYREDKKDGRGTFTFSNGTFYKGEFKDDKMHGQGERTFKDGGHYNGEFRHHLMEGSGMYSFADGATYKGEFLNDKFHGHGERTFSHGDHYKGEFREQNAHGQGLYTFVDGSIYDGKWENNCHHGAGLLTSSDGCTSEGTWEKGKKHGNFRRKPKVGAQTAEVWKNGSRLSSRKLPRGVK